MKTPILTTILLLLIHFTYSQPHTDDSKTTDKKWSVSVTLGFTAFGGNYEMARLMQKYRFIETRRGFFGPIDYPRKESIPALAIEADYLIKPNQRIGISLAASDFGTTRGFKLEAGEIYVSHRDLSLQPYYAIYLLRHIFQLRLGPSFHLKSLYRDYSSADKKFGHATINPKSNVRAGLYAEGSVAFFDKKNAYLRLLFAGFYTPGNLSIGPFTGRILTGETVEIFPEEEIGNSHVVIGLRYGIKL